MNISDTLSNSLTSLLSRKIRTFLTSFAVFVGVFIIIILVSLSNGAQDIIISQITTQFDLRSAFVFRSGTLNVNFFSTQAEEEKEDSNILNNVYLDQIRKIENVQYANPLLNIPARKFEFVDKDYDSRVVNSAAGAGWDIVTGDSVVSTLFAGKYDNLQSNEIVLTKDLIDAYQKTPEEVIGKKIKLTDQPILFGSQSKPIEPIEYIVVGVIEKIRNFVYIISLEEGLQTLTQKNGYLTVDEYINTAGFQSVYVKASEERFVEQIASEIRNLGFDVSTLEDVLSVFSVLFTIIPFIFTIIGGIAIFVSAIGIINTMLMSVFERTREIGVLKAVGAKNRDILSLFITESGMIGGLGGGLAVFLSLFVMGVGNNLFMEKVVPQVGLRGVDYLFIYDNNLLIYSFLASLLTGILAGLYPAIRASRLNPVDALRFE
jgi:putative ABC transport system permease protein